VGKTKAGRGRKAKNNKSLGVEDNDPGGRRGGIMQNTDPLGEKGVIARGRSVGGTWSKCEKKGEDGVQGSILEAERVKRNGEGTERGGMALTQASFIKEKRERERERMWDKEQTKTATTKGKLLVPHLARLSGVEPATWYNKQH
jgi:hypothetical protein